MNQNCERIDPIYKAKNDAKHFSPNLSNKNEDWRKKDEVREEDTHPGKT